MTDPSLYYINFIKISNVNTNCPLINTKAKINTLYNS